MPNVTKRTLVERVMTIIDYFERNRAVGHSFALKNGMARSWPVIFFAHTTAHAEAILKGRWKDNKRPYIATPATLTRLRERKLPMVFDHVAVTELFKDLLRVIFAQDEVIESLERKVRDLEKENTKLLDGAF